MKKIIVIVILSYVNLNLLCAQELWIGAGFGFGYVRESGLKFQTVDYVSLPVFNIKYIKYRNPSMGYGVEMTLYDMHTAMLDNADSNLEKEGWDLKNNYLETQLFVKHNIAGSKVFSIESGMAIGVLLKSKYREDPNKDKDFSDVIEMELPHKSPYFGIPLRLNFAAVKLFGSATNRLSFSGGTVFWLSDFSPDSSNVPNNLPLYYNDKMNFMSFFLKIGIRII